MIYFNEVHVRYSASMSKAKQLIFVQINTCFSTLVPMANITQQQKQQVVAVVQYAVKDTVIGVPTLQMSFNDVCKGKQGKNSSPYTINSGSFASN